MKRKFATLAVLAAAFAALVPASSMASMYPAGHKFEIAGGSTLGTSLGSCTMGKITGTIPAAPANETTTPIAVAAPAVSSCAAGTTMSTSGSWTFATGITAGYLTALVSNTPESVVMRFSSLPGCKLTTSGSVTLFGIWSNGTTVPTLLKSGYHADRGFALTWANDGASCALAGKTEAVSYEDETYGTSTRTPQVRPVTDLTSPGTPIIAGINK